MIGAELFAGCGGLALGMSRAGFTHSLMAEFDHDAVETVLHNRKRRVKHVAHWPMELTDVRDIDWSRHTGTLDIVSGGPPCQPFGIGGKKLGHEDSRDMWPEAVRAIREGAPKAFLFENVRNLAGPRFQPYLDWITLHLRYPNDTRRVGEDFDSHRERLRLSSKPGAYQVRWQVVNAADFGAPQIRFRVLIAGLAASFGVAPEALRPTHSRDRLLWDQFVTGDYWRRHGLPKRERPTLLRDQARVEQLRAAGMAPAGLPWVTVRDALLGLGEPDGTRNHVFQAGARVYPGHTGSPLDLPAKALKAGDHGVPGGENMMVRDDGSVRYFTMREAARLVGLPDDFEFSRSWSETMRQLGNAVPAQLGEAAGRWMRSMIERENEEEQGRAVA
ncbi:DNA cytosine methyltransferase [Sphingomonas sp. CJ20]